MGRHFFAWKINSQFDFSGDAKKTVKSEASNLIKEARKKEFPKMAQFFVASSQEFQSLNLSNEESIRNWVTSKISASENFMDSLPKDAEPFVLKIAELVQKENWQTFLESFEKENTKILKEKSKCVSKMRDEIDDWLGALSAAQTEAIEKYCGTRKDTPEIRVKNREHMMTTFKRWMEPAPGDFNSVRFLTAVKKWLAEYKSLQLPEAQEKWKTSRQQLIQSLTQILMSATEAQKKKFAENLNDRAQSLTRLSL